MTALGIRAVKKVNLRNLHIDDNRSLKDRNEEFLTFRYPWTRGFVDVSGNQVFWLDQEFMPGAKPSQAAN